MCIRDRPYLCHKTETQDSSGHLLVPFNFFWGTKTRHRQPFMFKRYSGRGVNFLCCFCLNFLFFIVSRNPPTSKKNENWANTTRRSETICQREQSTQDNCFRSRSCSNVFFPYVHTHFISNFVVGSRGNCIKLVFCLDTICAYIKHVQLLPQSTNILFATKRNEKIRIKIS